MLFRQREFLGLRNDNDAFWFAVLLISAIEIPPAK